MAALATEQEREVVGYKACSRNVTYNINTSEVLHKHASVLVHIGIGTLGPSASHNIITMCGWVGLSLPLTLVNW